MRLWMVWALLAVIWALQAAVAALAHRTRPAIVMFAMSAFFAAIGMVVKRRTASSGS